MEFKAEGPDLCRADHSGLGSEKTMSALPKEEWSQIEILTGGLHFDVTELGTQACPGLWPW